jgi:hypothetical protein
LRTPVGVPVTAIVNVTPRVPTGRADAVAPTTVGPETSTPVVVVTVNAGLSLSSVAAKRPPRVKVTM